MAKDKLYAVRNGRTKGIFTEYSRCLDSVKGYPLAEYKSFSTREEALAYLNHEENILDLSLPTVYCDGSYNVKTNEYSFGAVLLIDAKEYNFKRKFGPDEYSEYRNVSGEVRGAAFMINYCLKKSLKEINLCYDYVGIEKWFLGEWKANNVLTQNYQDFGQKVKNKIKVNFIKIKAHSNDKYNDLADRLAKDALGIK